MAILAFTTIIFALLWVGTLTESKETNMKDIEKVEKQKPFKPSADYDETALTFAENTLKNFYTFNNENYLKRFNDLETQADLSIVEQMKAMTATEIPEIQFKNEVLAIHSYLDPRAKEEGETVLIILETRYSIEGGNTYERSELLQATVKEKDGQWIMTELEHQGAMYPENEI